MAADPEGLARLEEGAGGAEAEGAMMAAMQEFAEKGNQIFITLVRGKEYPPTTVDVRCGYNQTIGELRQKTGGGQRVPGGQAAPFLQASGGSSGDGREDTARAEPPHRLRPLGLRPEGPARVLPSCRPHPGWSRNRLSADVP